MNTATLRKWIRQNKTRTLALTLALFYLIIAFAFGDEGDGLKMIIFLLFPLGGIFFSQSLGDYTGPSAIGAQPHITKPTPAFLVRILAWIFLFLPIFAVIGWLTTPR